MNLKPVSYTACLIILALGIAGCEAAGLIGTASYYGRELLSKEEVNFREKNFAAADYLVGQARNTITLNDLIVAEPLTDIRQPTMNSPIRKMVPEQIGVRMAQLGYRMDLQKVATTGDVNYLKPALRDGEQPKYILTGNFLRRSSDVDVSLRIVDPLNGRVVSAFDYVLPKGKDVKAISTPQPQIIRMNPQ